MTLRQIQRHPFGPRLAAITLPRGARILHVDQKPGDVAPSVWCLVPVLPVLDEPAVECAIVGTGSVQDWTVTDTGLVAEGGWRHAGTVVMTDHLGRDLGLVWHVQARHVEEDRP